MEITVKYEKMKKQAFLLLCLLMSPALFAKVSLPKIIGNNMVLQQGKPVDIWGTADSGEEVTVHFVGKTYTTAADAAGNWSVSIGPFSAAKQPEQMVIQGNDDEIVLENILVGEVWLASGQSNMEYSMNEHPQYLKPQKGDPDYLYNEYIQADNPLIRVLYVEKNLKADSLPSKGWQLAAKETLAPVSAAAYFFAKHISNELDVPVGIISTSWGGTPIETWTPEDAYRNSAYFSPDLIDGKLDNTRVGERYDKMILPLVPYTLKGFLWYQGETNLMKADTLRYAEKMKVLVDSWRTAWKDPHLPFYYAQIAPHTYSKRDKDRIKQDVYGLPLFWEVQSLAQDIQGTGMIVTTDLVDDAGDIHPPYKWIVGERFARLALAKDYGRDDLPYSGPVYRDFTVSGNQMVLNFAFIGDGLSTRDGNPPDWFEICGEDGIFYPADAVIGVNKITLSSEKVDHPVAARFAWNEIAMPNLINSHGLPAVPFRTNSLHWKYYNPVLEIPLK